MSIVELRGVAFSYFVVGVVMYGSGLIGYEETGIVRFLFADGDTGGPGVEAFGTLADTLGSVGAVLGLDAFAGTIIAMVNFATEIFTFLFWPFSLLMSAGAPFQVSLLLGGGASFLFFFGIIDVLARR